MCIESKKVGPNSAGLITIYVDLNTLTNLIFLFEPSLGLLYFVNK